MTNFKKKSSPMQADLPFDSSVGALGDLAHEARLRGAITQMIRKSPLSRAQIAERLSQRLGEQVSEDMLNNITADSHRGHRIPLLWAIAISVILADLTILEMAANIAGLKIHTIEDELFFELGRAEAQRQKIGRYADNLKEKASGKV